MITNNTNWRTDTGKRVLIVQELPHRNLVKGFSHVDSGNCFGFWDANTGKAFDLTACDIGNLTQLIAGGDGKTGVSLDDQAYGRVPLREIYSDVDRLGNAATIKPSPFPSPEDTRMALQEAINTIQRMTGRPEVRVLATNDPSQLAVVGMDPTGGLQSLFSTLREAVDTPPTDSGTDAEALAAELLSDMGWVFDGQTWTEPATTEGIVSPGVLMHSNDVPGYEILRAALEAAYDQAARGKGKERHANDLGFGDQPICTLNRMQGSVHGATYQVMKKVQESARLPVPRARTELLGAIVYAAAAWHMLGEGIGQ